MGNYCFKIKYLDIHTKDKEKGELLFVVADSFQQAIEWVEQLCDFDKLLEILCLCRLDEIMTHKDSLHSGFNLRAVK